MASTDGVTYTIQFVNNSTNEGSALVFQKDGDTTGDSTVPLNQASVGIGMSGAGTFVVQAQPDQDLSDTQKNEYRIAFGNYTRSEALDISQVNNHALVSFPPGIYTMTATLNQDNSWTITPGESGE